MRVIRTEEGYNIEGLTVDEIDFICFALYYTGACNSEDPDDPSPSVIQSIRNLFLKIEDAL